MFAEFEPKAVDFRSSPNPSISLQAIELEEAVLGAILLDPGAIALAESLPIQAFSISNHRQIFGVMRDLHQKNLKPDLLTVTFTMTEQGILQSAGGKSKLVSLLDRTVHSVTIKQYIRLLQEKYYRRYLSENFSRMAMLALTESDFGCTLFEAQKHLDRIKTVTSDSLTNGDTTNLDTVSLAATVTSVTAILEKGLPDWEEQANLDALQSLSGISKASFWHLVASQRCQFDEVTPVDEQQVEQLIDWKNATLDFQSALPHLASDLLHDGRVLNIDPIMLWQYLLPTTLSLVGKKVDLDVGSHKVPAIAWTCSVGESGTGKSRAEGLILSPLKAWQEEEYKRFKAEWEEYKASQHKKGEENGEPVVTPVAERKFLFEVATIQAVMRRLSEQGSNGSLWARDELAGLFKSLGQFTAKGEGEGLECLLPMWDGTSAPVDRVLYEDSYFLAASRLGIAGGLQPGVFRKSFTDPEDAQGLQARFLFALPKVQPAKRVKGYCHLAEFLPEFYRWVDTQFPQGTLKLSRAADARYDVVYEDIGRQAELAETPAVRAWMRKLPGQLLRIAIALHIVECYHEPGRSRHEIQLDTLNRAVDFCRYYRSAFCVVQQSVSDSDSISSILLLIWDKAATSPEGLAVRDAYRNIKALARRAKELGRNVGAYTIDLYYQLEKMGKGIVQRQGRNVRFVVSTNSPPTIPESDAKEGVTVVTVPTLQAGQGIQVSPDNEVSPVTLQESERFVRDTNDINVQDLSTAPDNDANNENSPSGEQPDDEPPDDEPPGDQFGDRGRGQGSYPTDKSKSFQTHPKALPSSPELYLGGGGVPMKPKPNNPDDGSVHEELLSDGEQDFAPPSGGRVISLPLPDGSDGDGTQEELLSDEELQGWLDRMSACANSHDCITFFQSVDQLLPLLNKQIWQACDPLLPRFWEVAEIGVTVELPQNPGLGFGVKEQDTITTNNPPDQPLPASTYTVPEVTNSPTFNSNAAPTKQAPTLKTGMWVCCSDGFYGYLGARTQDGCWWVLSPKSRKVDATSRLYAAADIIPVPTS